MENFRRALGLLLLLLIPHTSSLIPSASAAGTNIYISNLPRTNSVVDTNLVIVEIGGLGTNSTQTITVGNLRSNLVGGVEMWRTNWTAGADAGLIKTNTLFTVPLYAGSAALFEVSFVHWDALNRKGSHFDYFAGYYATGTLAVLSGAQVNHVSIAGSTSNGLFFSVSTTNILISGYGVDSSTNTGRARLQITRTPN